MRASSTRPRSSWREARRTGQPRHRFALPAASHIAEWRPANKSLLDLTSRARSRARARLGIVLMCRAAPPAAVNSFLTYHFAIGFERIFLYLDDASEDYWASLVLEQTERLIVHRCDARFWAERLASSTMVAHRTEQKVFDDVARCWKTEAQSRQSLCVEHAITLGSELGLDWLLHIDVDEAFLPATMHPCDFFAAVPAEYDQCFFANLEGVPEREDIIDWFCEVERFKVNMAFVTDRVAFDAVWQQVEAARRNAEPTSEPSSYFIAYTSGKSAIRLPHRGTCRLPVPFDVHKFLVPAVAGGWRAASTLSCAQQLAMEDCPVVLHYPSCGYANWRAKYTALGNHTASSICSCPALARCEHA